MMIFLEVVIAHIIGRTSGKTRERINLGVRKL